MDFEEVEGLRIGCGVGVGCWGGGYRGSRDVFGSEEKVVVFPEEGVEAGVVGEGGGGFVVGGGEVAVVEVDDL